VVELIVVIEQGFIELTKQLSSFIATSANDPTCQWQIDELHALREKAVHTIELLRSLRGGKT
jgi:hypothetical protein